MREFELEKRYISNGEVLGFNFWLEFCNILEFFLLSSTCAYVV